MTPPSPAADGLPPKIRCGICGAKERYEDRKWCSNCERYDIWTNRTVGRWVVRAVGLAVVTLIANFLLAYVQSRSAAHTREESLARGVLVEQHRGMLDRVASIRTHAAAIMGRRASLSTCPKSTAKECKAFFSEERRRFRQEVFQLSYTVPGAFVEDREGIVHAMDVAWRTSARSARGMEILDQIHADCLFEKDAVRDKCDAITVIRGDLVELENRCLVFVTCVVADRERKLMNSAFKLVSRDADGTDDEDWFSDLMSPKVDTPAIKRLVKDIGPLDEVSGFCASRKKSNSDCMHIGDNEVDETVVKFMATKMTEDALDIWTPNKSDLSPTPDE